MKKDSLSYLTEYQRPPDPIIIRAGSQVQRERLHVILQNINVVENQRKMGFATVS